MVGGGRGRSFGAVARAYDAYRPGYPDAAVDWALAPLAGLEAGNGLDLLDLGAGTGKLTASLVRRPRARVTAVEPDPEMLAVLRAGLPGVTAVLGGAEAIGLPDASVHAVLVGQALHWFDIEPATAEIVRVLRPGGVVAALSNGEDSEVEWVRGYYQSVGRGERVGQEAGYELAFAEHPALEPGVRATFASPVTTTVDGLLDTLGTYSWISTLDDAERRATMAAARAYLAARPELGPAGSTFELPLRTTVLRAGLRTTVLRR